MVIRATAKCPEIIAAGDQKRQCGADGRRVTFRFIAGMSMSESLDLLHAELRNRDETNSIIRHRRRLPASKMPGGQKPEQNRA
jgi:hypothetical protein